MLRHLPPTATPLPPATLASAAYPSQDATERFRAAFTAYSQTEACYVASSGRTALFLLLRALMASAGTQRTMVILPAYTCPSLGKVVLEAGLQPRWVDIAPETLNYLPTALAQAIDAETLAVICVHPFGIPHSVREAVALARAAGAAVIEDAAQSMGAHIEGRLAGTGADYGLFSLGPGKPLSAGGGGIVTANHPSAAATLATHWQAPPEPSAAASALALLRLSAFTAAFHPLGWWFATRAGAQKAGESEASWGFALSGLTRAQSHVALEQLPQLADYNRCRRRNAEAILRALAGISWLTTPAPNANLGQPATPIYLRLPLIAETEARCAEVYGRLWAAGIGVGRMYRKTMPELFPHVPVSGRYPGAEHVASALFTLPTHHYVTPQDITRMGEILRGMGA